MSRVSTTPNSVVRHTELFTIWRSRTNAPGPTRLMKEV